MAGLGELLSTLGGNQRKPNAHLLTEQEAITAAEADWRCDIGPLGTL